MSRRALDHRFLDRAGELARKGWGRVHPNPMVGCVLVRDGRIVAEGWHREFGGPHAEVEALRHAGEGADGATAYISLEPCSHHGKTPPCTDALLAAGVARVVFGAPDPGPASGGGGAVLRQAGLDVRGPVWDRDRSRAENPAFYHGQERAGPWVAVKLALSLDGMIAEREGTRTRVTGPEAAEWVHDLRRGFDAILVGARTARVDDPLLTVRLAPEPRRAPARVVLDATASLSPSAKMLDEPGGPVIVLVAPDADPERVTRLRRAGATVCSVEHDEGGLDVDAALDVLGKRGVTSVLCEGGGRVTGSLLRADRVQRMYLLTGPITLGSGGVPAFGPGPDGPDWSLWRPHGAPSWIGSDRLSVYRKEY